jgi:hypothetical protein
MPTIRLFRQESIDHQRFRIWREMAIALPNSYALVTGSSRSWHSRQHPPGAIASGRSIIGIDPSLCTARSQKAIQSMRWI